MLAQAEDVRGGLYKVHLRFVASGQACKFMGWFHTLCEAVTKTFDCKTYFVTRHVPGRTPLCYRAFYGLEENAYAAALAFEHAFNRVAVMMAAHVPPPEEYERLVAGGSQLSRIAHTKQAKLSYAEGVADGLRARVYESSVDEDDAPEEAVDALSVITTKAEAEVRRRFKLDISTTANRYSRQPKRGSYTQGVADAAHINLKQSSITG